MRSGLALPYIWVFAKIMKKRELLVVDSSFAEIPLILSKVKVAQLCLEIAIWILISF